MSIGHLGLGIKRDLGTIIPVNETKKDFNLFAYCQIDLVQVVLTSKYCYCVL